MTQPTDKTGRKICTKEHPWKPKNKGERWMHPKAEYLGDEDDPDGGQIEYYRCPICDCNFTSHVGQ